MDRIRSASTILDPVAEFLDAAVRGDFKKVEFMLKNNSAIDVNAKDQQTLQTYDKAVVSHNSALYRAAQGGHLEVVKFLLEHGATIDARSSENATVRVKLIFDSSAVVCSCRIW